MSDKWKCPPLKSWWRYISRTFFEKVPKAISRVMSLVFIRKSEDYDLILVKRWQFLCVYTWLCCFNSSGIYGLTSRSKDCWRIQREERAWAGSYGRWHQWPWFVVASAKRESNENPARQSSRRAFFQPLSFGRTFRGISGKSKDIKNAVSRMSAAAMGFIIVVGWPFTRSRRSLDLSFCRWDDILG